MYISEDDIIKLAFDENQTAICMAANENYAPYCAVTIYSLIKYRDKSKQYDIIIMNRDIREDTKEYITKLEEGNDGVRIRFFDAGCYDEELSSDVGAYYTIETNYRLMILSDIFTNYDKILYLDCDILIEGDISGIFDIDMDGKAAVAVKDHSMMCKQLCLSPIFIENEPYSFKNYCKDVLNIKNYEMYFNAGVTMFDLKVCLAQGFTFEKASNILQSRYFVYNDQDVLNIILEDNVKYIDEAWNYLNSYDEYCRNSNADIQDMYIKIHRKNPVIIHFLGYDKPWNNSNLPKANYYWKEIRALERKIPYWNERF